MNNLPPAANDIEMNGPGQWGRLVYMSPNGMHSIYVLDFGRGHRVITHVTWTEERAAINRGEQ